MRTLPRPAQLYIWTTVLIGACLLAAYGPRSVPDLVTLGSVLLFTILIFFADLSSISLPWGAYVTVSASVIFATVALHGVGYGCLAAGIGIAAANIFRRKPLSRILFNSMGTIIWTGLAAIAYITISDGNPFPFASWQNAAALVVYVVVDFAANTVLLALIICLTQRVHIKQVWGANLKGVASQFLTVFPLGALIVAAHMQWAPFGVLLLFLPLAILYYSLRKSRDMYRQTTMTIEALAEAVDKRDPYTFEHSSAVSIYAERIASRMQLPVDEITTILLAARVHDLGKIAISDAILRKNGPLSDSERLAMQSHPSIGAQMVSNLSLYKKGLELILYHHERWDGKGYPAGLMGEEIPLGARIMAVADSYQAMTSDRPYRKAMSVDAAIAELERGRGTQFDAHIVDVFVAILKEEEVARPFVVTTLEQKTA